MPMFIKLIGKSTIAILAIAALLTILSGINLRDQAIIAIGIDMFGKVLVGLIVITIVINLPKILHVLFSVI